MIPSDLARQELVQIVLQWSDGPGQFFQAIEGQHAYLRVFERNRVAPMAVAGDAVEPDDVTGHVVAGDLFAPILGKNGGFARSNANRVKRSERFSNAVERRPLFKPRPIRNDRVELIHRNVEKFGTITNTLSRACEVTGTVSAIAPPR